MRLLPLWGTVDGKIYAASEAVSGLKPMTSGSQGGRQTLPLHQGHPQQSNLWFLTISDNKKSTV